MDRSRSNSHNSFKGHNRVHTETFAKKHQSHHQEEALKKLKGKERGRNGKLGNSRSHSHNPK